MTQAFLISEQMLNSLQELSVERQKDMRGCFIILIFSCPITITGADPLVRCHDVEGMCKQDPNVPRCIEDKMKLCSKKQGRIPVPGYYTQHITYSETMLNTTEGHTIHIPSEVLQKISADQRQNETGVDLIVSVLNKTFFRTNSGSEVVHGENVLGVWLGVNNIHNLSGPVQLRFRNISQAENGTCVYWRLDENGDGDWSTAGCSTGIRKDEVVCSCNHLSFFAVLVNSEIPEEIHIVHLSYISYVGSALSMVFTIIVIVMFLWQRKQRENSVIIHAQLAGSLFLLHTMFLCSVWFSGRGDEVCSSLGLLLHWCLLVTFSWTAIEGFHLYLLLVRVFNIYINRYLLKLSLVAWGVPTVTVMICGIIGKYVSVYGKYALQAEKENSTSASICWITTQTVSFLTVNAYLGLVMIFNTVMLVVVLVKMHQLRSQDRRVRNSKRRVWKDWASLLGLCCVLGIPWSLAFFTRVPLNLPALYLFTLLNSFQGVFIFLWFLTVTCQAQKEEQVSSKGTIQVNFQSHEEHVTTSLVNNVAKTN